MVSLIVCTRNRCTSLTRCLDALRRINMPPEHWEVVIVDNASTDATREVVERFAAEVPFRVRIVHEAKPGLGRARNAGVRAAAGDILAFTDDDCYVDENYLRQICHIFETTGVSCIGGRVLLHDPTDAPVTIKEQDEAAVLDPYSFVETGFIHGANMAVRREVLVALGGFDAALGAGTPFAAEDVDFFARASHAGFRVGYFPEPLVYHHHQRKPGPDVRKLYRVYDHGRGAYYAKFLMFGSSRVIYLKHWYWSIRSCLRHRNFQTPARELRGALHYAARALRHPRSVGLRVSN